MQVKGGVGLGAQLIEAEAGVVLFGVVEELLPFEDRELLGDEPVWPDITPGVWERAALDLLKETLRWDHTLRWSAAAAVAHLGPAEGGADEL